MVWVAPLAPYLGPPRSEARSSVRCDRGNRRARCRGSEHAVTAVTAATRRDRRARRDCRDRRGSLPGPLAQRPRMPRSLSNVRAAPGHLVPCPSGAPRRRRKARAAPYASARLVCCHVAASAVRPHLRGCRHTHSLTANASSLMFARCNQSSSTHVVTVRFLWPVT